MVLLISIIATLIASVVPWLPPSTSENLFFSVLYPKQLSGPIAELKSHLSGDALVLLPGGELFMQATTRWQRYRDPDINLVVDVANEQDIQQTILWANEHSLPFLAKAGGHGAIDSLGGVKNGVQIHMRQMKYVEIAADGMTAKFGGGVNSKDVTDALWLKRKQTVTGACECVGVVAPMMGGGHGFLQGQHGLLADQLLEARLVLANGTAVTVSNDSHSDLFWAIRGAGHNFGVVVELTYKIYDVNPDNTWAFEAFTFTGDKLEALYDLTNDMMKTQPAGLMNYALFLSLPEVDLFSPVIVYYILYDGPAAIEREYTAGIHALGPSIVQADEVPYTRLPNVTENHLDGLACQNGAVAMRFPIDLDHYDVPSLREVYNKFAALMQEVPAFNRSFFLLEGYSVQAVQAIAADSTAFPHRSDTLLLSPVIYYAPNTSLDARAVQAGTQLRGILHEGSGKSEMDTYVNYAHGDESLENMYGYEPWRVERLKSLKQEYDPQERFSWYAPIPPAEPAAPPPAHSTHYAAPTYTTNP